MTLDGDAPWRMRTARALSARPWSASWERSGTNTCVRWNVQGKKLGAGKNRPNLGCIFVTYAHQISHGQPSAMGFPRFHAQLLPCLLKTIYQRPNKKKEKQSDNSFQHETPHDDLNINTRSKGS